MKDNFYKQLTDDEKQICDLCRDWNLGECEKCEFVSRFSFQNDKRGGKNMNVVLYSTHCPNCTVLEKKLKQKNIEFLEVNDIEIMKEKGFMSAPMLDVDGIVMSFRTAIQWINNQ